MRILLLVLFALNVSSCASMIAAECNYDSAFKKGMNDANDGKNMAEHVSAFCPEEKVADVEKGYRKGYLKGKEASQEDTIVKVVSTITDAVTGKERRKKECLERFGTKACGYDCKAAYGQVKCAQKVSHNCVEAFGEIRCGKNCRSEYGTITCEQ